jgi:hypothetical protein
MMQGIVALGPISSSTGAVIILLSMSGIADVLIWLTRTAKKRKLGRADIVLIMLIGAALLFFLAIGVHWFLWPSL